MMHTRSDLMDRSAPIETRLLQAAIAIACIVPLSTGGSAVLFGAELIGGSAQPVSVNFDSHFRYLSGLLFAAGLGFLSCVPDIARKGGRMRLLGGLVIVGGLGRLASLLMLGPPSAGHQFALAMELGVTPALLLWQWRVARKQPR